MAINCLDQGFKQDLHLRRENTSVDPLIPLSLQSLCFLKVINDLDCYPVDLLALLPLWLRSKLLRNLPVVDLCSLVHTSVACGVDVEKIWRYKLTHTPSLRWQKSLNKFSYKADETLRMRQRFFNPEDSYSYDDHLNLALGKLKDDLSYREKYLSRLIAAILLQKDQLNSFIGSKRNLLISITCKTLLQDLPQSSVLPHVSWKTQAIFSPGFKGHSYYGKDQIIIPHHLKPRGNESSDEQWSMILSLLAKHCCVQLPSITLNIGEIEDCMLSSLYNGYYAKDQGLKLASGFEEMSVSLIKGLLSKVKLLQLLCYKYSHIGIMKGMIEAAKANKERESDCHLKYLFCTLPDLYFVIVKPLCSVFSLQNFKQLTLELDEAYILNLSELFQDFIETHCVHSQTLHVQINNASFVPKIKEMRITANKRHSIPTCAIKHKKVSSNADSNNVILFVLLQLPTIRLKEITITNNFLHLSALHPDFQVTRLNLKLNSLPHIEGCNTIESHNIISLLAIPTLKEFSVSGLGWSNVAEAKLGIKNGLINRRQVASLSKISLCVDSLRLQDKEAAGYSQEEYQELWDAIFSLPQVEKLKVTLGALFTKMTMQQNYKVLLESWSTAGGNNRLKSITLTLSESTPEVHEQETLPLKQLAQTFTFITKDNNY